MSDKSIQDQIGMADSFEEALRLITENPPKPDAKYNRQPVNMSLIKVDPERLQSRVETSREVVEQYKIDSQSGDQFPPMVVFFDIETQTAWLADGFHRWHMYKELGYRWADCDVKFGTLQDAIVYAASANAKHGLRIKAEDRRKAADMLFSINEWLNGPAKNVADRVGVAQGTALEWRTQYVLRNNINLDDYREDSNGKKFKTKKIHKVTSLDLALKKIVFLDKNPNRKSGNTGYYVRSKGCIKRVGSTEEEAKKNVESLFNDGYFSRDRPKSRKSDYIGDASWLRSMALRSHVLLELPGTRGKSRRPGSNPFGASEIDPCMLVDVVWSGGVAKLAKDICQVNFTQFYGDVELGRGVNKSDRAVIVCYLPPECDGLRCLALKNGVECLTPNEFIGSFSKNMGEAESA